MSTRKLIEVALPLEAINDAGRREKSVPKKGHPATMHLWWSRKPLGVARAITFASLVDDPSSRPAEFPTAEDQAVERQRLFDLLSRLCRWDETDNRELMRVARRRIADDCNGDLPKFIDPFSGGGALPIEGLRLGLDTLAVDLNPVAAMVTAASISIAQRFAGQHPIHAPTGSARLRLDTTSLEGLADDVRHYGVELAARVERLLGDAYRPVASPHSPSGETVPVSYLWARTIHCANPGCGNETPLLSTWWLSKKKSNLWHARPEFTEGGSLRFAVHEGATPGELEDLKVGHGATYRCVFCNEVNSSATVRDYGRQHGFGARLVAIQAFRDPAKRRSGRVYLDPPAEVEVDGREGGAEGPADGPLSMELPSGSGNITEYGLTTFGHLLTPRQRRMMNTLIGELHHMREELRAQAAYVGMPDDGIPLSEGGEGAGAYADAIATYLGLTVSRMANRVTTMTIHNRHNGSVEQTFVQPAYAFYGDSPEANPFSGSTGSWGNSLEHMWKAIAALPTEGAGKGEVRVTTMLSALEGERGLISTDPPYYDTFDYSKLSNLFYVWQRAALRPIWPSFFGGMLTPSEEQIVSSPSRHGGDRAAAHNHFESLLGEAFVKMRDSQDPRFPVTIYYGYQQTSRTSGGRSSTAWEALLEGIISAGLRIISTWPLRTERPEGVKSGSNSLATSVLLVCRPAPVDHGLASVQDFRRTLRAELPRAIELLQEGGVAPVDLAQAAIGPGMEIFTRYSRVMTAEGQAMTVRAALQAINEVLDETLSSTDSDFDAVTRFALTWYETHGLQAGPYGEAESLSKSRNVSLDDLAAEGLLESRGGRVRLLDGRDFRTMSADAPSNTTWGATQRAMDLLAEDGEVAAATHLRLLTPARRQAVRGLTFRLFQIALEAGRSSEANRANALIVAWSTGMVDASSGTSPGEPSMASLFD